VRDENLKIRKEYLLGMIALGAVDTLTMLQTISTELALRTAILTMIAFITGQTVTITVCGIAFGTILAETVLGTVHAVLLIRTGC